MERRAPKRVTTVGIVNHVTKTRANVTVSDVFFQDSNHLLVMVKTVNVFNVTGFIYYLRCTLPDYMFQPSICFV